MMRDEVNMRSPCYDILRARFACPYCASTTTVAAVYLPAGHQTLELSDGSLDASDVWQTATQAALLFDLEFLPRRVLERLQAVAPGFDASAARSCEPPGLVNHCERCLSPIADELLFGEPGGAFLPTSAAAAAVIEAQRIVEPLEAMAGGYAPEPFFFDAIGRVSARGPGP